MSINCKSPPLTLCSTVAAKLKRQRLCCSLQQGSKVKHGPGNKEDTKNVRAISLLCSCNLAHAVLLTCVAFSIYHFALLAYKLTHKAQKTDIFRLPRRTGLSHSKQSQAMEVCNEQYFPSTECVSH